MAEMVKSVIVGEAVSRIISGIAPTSKDKDKADEEASGGGGLERLEMAHIKMELSREEDQAEQVVRKSLFPRRMAHATKVFISSFVGRDNDHCSAGSATAAVVRRFERLVDGADEFIRSVPILPHRANQFPGAWVGGLSILHCHTSLSEYKNLPGSTVFAGHDDNSSLENSQPLKLGILLMPHASLEEPKSVGSTVEVVDTENRHHLTHVNVHLDQLDEMMMPKVIDYLHLNAEAMSYQWTDYHNCVAAMVSWGDGSSSSKGFGGDSLGRDELLVNFVEWVDLELAESLKDIIVKAFENEVVKEQPKFAPKAQNEHAFIQVKAELELKKFLDGTIINSHKVMRMKL
ncbi:unnamed protein product [Triticum turgidum subsp. durum]|uniref:Uncharacterized protein n=1 Tax=Triticum turgidum subsp. durum TaxID=4567 RepID=A0A9R1QWY9_TRITD|nr:unnamed protein product [Triticum turgidum subsp. durum]